MRRITYGEMTAGRMPSRASVNPIRVPSAATTTSAAASSPAPPPSAAPCTRAITAFGRQSIAS